MPQKVLRGEELLWGLGASIQEKRSMVSGGWKRFKTKRLSINFYESQGLVSKDQDLRKKRKRPSVRWWAVTNPDERLWSRKPSSLFPASASCLLAS